MAPRRKKTRKTAKDETVGDETVQGDDGKSGTNLVWEKAAEWMNRTLNQTVTEIQQDFKQQVARYKLPFTAEETAAFTANRPKNRYNDVPCIENNRIKINGDGYIHANMVELPCKRRFICTQGPMEATTVDFWQMVVEQASEQIVMLCNTKECGRDKCAQYWPDNENETVTHGVYAITNENKFQFIPTDDSVMACLLSIKWKADGQEKIHKVRHLHWINWPDRGAPPGNKTTCTDLLSRIRRSPKPIIIHCSAGIGRTGTIIVVEWVLARLVAQQPVEEMTEIVKRIRDSRAMAVQNDVQFIYVHRVLLQYLLCKFKPGLERRVPDLTERVRKWYTDYAKACC